MSSSKATTTCKYPKCKESVPQGFKYCRQHSWYIREKGLCFNCLKKKDEPDFRLCSACHQQEREETRESRRQEAIEKGLCTNFWKCSKKATRKGGMCPDCYQEYQDKQEERQQQQRQEAIDAGLCTNFWKCSGPATIPGGMCEKCFQEYLLKHQITPKSVLPEPVVLTAIDFPPLPVKKTPPKPVEPKPATPKTVEPKPTTPKTVEPKPAKPKAVKPKPTLPTLVSKSGSTNWADICEEEEEEMDFTQPIVWSH